MDPPPGARAIHVIELDRRELFVATPDEVWTWMSRTERFPTWWRWLKEFESEGHGLQSGGVLRGLVVPPIPYRFRVNIHLDDVQPAAAITARLTGDLRGPAALTLTPVDGGCELAIRWRVEMRKPAMRAAARYARGLLIWGHDQVIDVTVRHFREIVDGPQG